MSKMENMDVFLSNAKASLIQEKELKARVVQLEDALLAKANALEAETKALQDQIDITLKTRLQELTKTYDDEHVILAEKLKKIRGKREKARNRGVKERITEETAQLHHENMEIKRKIKDEMRNHRVPFLCDTLLYRALYMPGSVTDFCIMAGVFLLCFAVIPLAVFYFVPWNLDAHIRLIIIYVISIAVFGGLYVLIANISKYKNAAALGTIRRLHKDIRLNQKKIKSITKGIKGDKNEDKYDLASFDDEISHTEKEISDLISKRQEALHNFENVTKNIITDELNSQAKPKIESLQAEKAALEQDLKNTESSRKDLSLRIGSEYEVYLGKEFLTEEKIDALSALIQEKQLSNLSEAMELYKTTSK